MNKNRKYPIDVEIFDKILPIIHRLEGLSVILNTLGDNIATDKRFLWETIYSRFPELKGMPLRIDEANREIIVAQQPETSRIETLPEG